MEDVDELGKSVKGNGVRGKTKVPRRTVGVLVDDLRGGEVRGGWYMSTGKGM